MSIKVLSNAENSIACLYDSVYEKVFGELIHGDSDGYARDIAEDFVKWAKYFGHEYNLQDTFSAYFWRYNEAIKLGEWPISDDTDARRI